MSSIWTNLFPPKPTWGTDDMPDLAGKVMIVTGGNAGIGKETVKVLLAHNAKVYMACRSPDRMQTAIEDLKRATGKEALPLDLDLADLTSVRACAEEFMRQEGRLDVLFNNAAAVFPAVAELTAQGYDMQFGTNVLGHYLLTELLMPLLVESATTSPDGKVRVVHTASMGHLFVSKLDYDFATDTPRRRHQSSVQLYFHSKFGNVVLSHEMHRRYAARGIVSVSLHPGNTGLDPKRHTSLLARLVGLTNALQPTPEMGALTQLFAGTVFESANFGGKYLIPWARLGEAKAETYDTQAGETLWRWLEQQARDV